MSKTPWLGGDVTHHNFDQLRKAMTDSQLRTTGVSDPRVVEAMGAVPREAYVPADRKALAYVDLVQPLGGGRALPSPMAVGRLLTEARVRPADRVLVVAAGTGYSAAVVALLAGKVTALEEDAALATGPAAMAERVTGPLADGWAANAPYDVVLIDGAIEFVPDAIVAQLAEHGRLATGLVENGVTRLAIGRKSGGAFGLISFADAEMPVLPAFVRPPVFTF